MRNKLAYSYSVKIHASGFNKLLEGIFCLLVVVEVFSLKKVVQMLEEVVDGWWVMTWIWWMRQNFIAQFVQLLKRRLCGLWLGIVVEKNWALSVDQCQLQALQFLVHLIDLLSVLLRYNGVFLHSESRSGSDGRQATCSDHDFSLVQVWLWEVLCSFFLVQPLTCW